MADGTVFVLPIVIDDTAASVLPVDFRALQCAHLPSGNPPSEFVDRLIRLHLTTRNHDAAQD
jgi:hypothetical protein